MGRLVRSLLCLSLSSKCHGGGAPAAACVSQRRPRTSCLHPPPPLATALGSPSATPPPLVADVDSPFDAVSCLRPRICPPPSLAPPPSPRLPPPSPPSATVVGSPSGAPLLGDKREMEALHPVFLRRDHERQSPRGHESAPPTRRPPPVRSNAAAGHRARRPLRRLLHPVRRRRWRPTRAPPRPLGASAPDALTNLSGYAFRPDLRAPPSSRTSAPPSRRLGRPRSRTASSMRSSSCSSSPQAPNLSLPPPPVPSAPTSPLYPLVHLCRPHRRWPTRSRRILSTFLLSRRPSLTAMPMSGLCLCHHDRSLMV
ncbi:hypothetical protein DAI22_06g179400 [Oryza sativa Japonica Group]|nr:hypothetical protein DAI22_06g179400 [Oryza sativa Japonica Group]